ncbi:hypothetical protein FIE12Z_8450 [Fusarium flagelliforme]|uniref:Uncharacterized protein n=1 Tax=Fusarium flagelliforme TaxID=2675880 RepID=A0A395MHE0_9HYPO|nr:hypothetical protein FIE12Z_8450 [Fusarium flagelliforme]
MDVNRVVTTTDTLSSTLIFLLDDTTATVPDNTLFKKVVTYLSEFDPATQTRTYVIISEYSFEGPGMNITESIREKVKRRNDTTIYSSRTISVKVQSS